MTALPSHLDERVRADLDDLIALKALPGSRAGRLVGALVGNGGGGHDRAFLIAAHAVHMAGLAMALDGPADPDRLVGWCLDPRLGRSTALRAAFEGTAVRRPGLTLTGDAEKATLNLSGEVFALSYGQLADACALLHFLLVADGLDLYGEIRAALAETDFSADRVADSLKALTRALSRIAYRYRATHFPERDFFRRNHTLVTFLAGRLTSGGSGAAIDDAMILAAWQGEIERGERTLFETTVRRCLAIEQALADRRSRGRGTDDLSVEDVIERFAVAPEVDGDGREPGFAEGASDTGPADWVASLPESPKVLTGAERDMLLGIVGLHPFHRTRALTVLRTAVFGTVQARLVKQRINGPLTPARLAPSGSYADEVDSAQRLVDHLVNIAVLLVEGARAVGDAEGGADLPRFRRIRREGFDRPLEEILADLSEARGPIAGLIDELRRYTSMASRVTVRFEADQTLFNEAFRQMYLSEGADG